MITLEQVRAWSAYANAKAFLRCIRAGESNQNDDAYTIVNGGAHFDAPPWIHPWHGIPTTKGAKACGAYQYLGTTWQGVSDALTLPDFSPRSQDLGAIYLIAEAGAINDVLAGNLVVSASRLRNIWISLPEMSLQRLQAIFTEYGGTPGQESTPEAATAPPRPAAPQPVPTQPQPTREAPMGPLMFLPAILQLIPQLAPLFGKNGDKATQYAGAAQTIVNAFTAAVPGALNAQDALEKAQADPTVKAAAVQATLEQPAITVLLEVGGGIPAARKQAQADAENPAWYRPLVTPAFLISLLLLCLVGFVVWNMLQGHTDLWRPEDRSQILMLTVAIVSGVMGYFLGSSLGSQKKDDALAGRAA